MLQDELLLLAVGSAVMSALSLGPYTFQRTRGGERASTVAGAWPPRISLYCCKRSIHQGALFTAGFNFWQHNFAATACVMATADTATRCVRNITDLAEGELVLGTPPVRQEGGSVSGAYLIWQEGGSSASANRVLPTPQALASSPLSDVLTQGLQAYICSLSNRLWIRFVAIRVYFAPSSCRRVRLLGLQLWRVVGCKRAVGCTQHAWARRRFVARAPSLMCVCMSRVTAACLDCRLFHCCCKR